MKRLIGALILALGLTCATFPLQAQQVGGAFIPSFSYIISGVYTWTQASPFVFEGATDDDSETTLTVTDPTADRTITLPNATDTLVGKATTDTLTNKTLTTPAITSSVTTGKPTAYSTVTTYTGATDAIDISLGDLFMLSRAGAADAATLADPAVGDNGRTIRIYSGTAFAHTITVAGGLGGAGTSDDVITFTNRIAAEVTLFAHNGKWYLVGSYLAAIA